MNVERVDLAPGLGISRLVTGLWQIADMERDGVPVDPERTADALERYVDAGFTSFDMADHYGSSEQVTGVLRTRPGRSGAVELFTKWVPRPGPMSRDAVRAAVERALDRMRADALDLLQFHAWSWSDPAWLDAFLHLEEAREAGLVRHLGVTNFDTAHLRMLLHSGVRVASNQVCYSLIDRRPARGLEALAIEHGVGLLAYGTVAGGLLTEAWLGRPEPGPDDVATWSQMKYRRFVAACPGGWDAFQEVLRATAEIARRHGVSMANVACRWVLERPGVAAVIVGARPGRSEHVEDNLRVFSFSLDDEDRALLAPALDALGVPPGDSGDEYRKPPYLTAAGDLSDHFDTFPAPYPVLEGPGARTRALSGTIWEDLAGFSRATRIGDRILVSGTTATHGSRVVGGDDPASQAHFCIDKIEGAVRALGGRLEDIVRTRVYIRHESDWEVVSRVHGERFGRIQPANTLLQAGIVGSEYLVEMEAEALVQDR